jgi:hypothetical protein
MEQAIPVYEDVEVKPVVRGERMLRSEAARTRRRELKTVRENRVINEWARARRAKKKK